MEKLVTVGIPFYNNERTLGFAIKSIQKQTYQNLEIILINDGSTDSSLEIANSFLNDTRIKVVNDFQNRGLIFRLNQIIDLASGDYICRMDSDDLSDPERIQKQIDLLEKNEGIDVVTTGMITINSEYRPIGKKYCDLKKPDLYKIFKNGFGLVHPSLCTRRGWYLQNKYREGFERAEDRELFTRTLKDSSYYIIPEPLYFYMEMGNMSLKKYLLSYSSERKALRKNGPSAIGLSRTIYLYMLSLGKSFSIIFIFLLKLEDKILKSKTQKIDNLDSYKRLIKTIMK